MCSPWWPRPPPWTRSSRKRAAALRHAEDPLLPAETGADLRPQAAGPRQPTPHAAAQPAHHLHLVRRGPAVLQLANSNTSTGSCPRRSGRWPIPSFSMPSPPSMESIPACFQSLEIRADGRIDEKSVMKSVWYENFADNSGEFLRGLEEILYAEIYAVKRHLGKEHEKIDPAMDQRIRQLNRLRQQLVFLALLFVVLLLLALMKPVIQILGADRRRQEPGGARRGRRSSTARSSRPTRSRSIPGFDIGTDKLAPGRPARHPPSPDRHHPRLRAVQRQQVPRALLRRRRADHAPAAGCRWSAAAPALYLRVMMQRHLPGEQGRRHGAGS